MTFALLVGNFSISKSKTNIMSELLSSHETNYVWSVFKYQIAYLEYKLQIVLEVNYKTSLYLKK